MPKIFTFSASRTGSRVSMAMGAGAVVVRVVTGRPLGTLKLAVSSWRENWCPGSMSRSVVPPASPATATSVHSAPSSSWGR